MPISPYGVSEALPDAYKNDFIYKQLIQYAAASQFARTFANLAKENLIEPDFVVRDVLFQNSLGEEPTLYDYLYKHYKPITTTQPDVLLRQAREKCQLKKFNFLKKWTKMPSTTREKLDTKNIIRDSKLQYQIGPLLGFTGFSIAMVYILKLYRNPIKFTFLTLGVGSGYGYIYGTYRYTNQSFNNIPELPDQEAEQERQQIVNYCFSLDIDLVSKYLLYEDNIQRRVKQKQRG